MKRKADKVEERIRLLGGDKIKPGESMEDYLLRQIDLIEKNTIKRISENILNNRRITSILEVVVSLAQLDYSKKAEQSGNSDHIDALAAGVNMLGEELKASTVSLSEKEMLLKEIHHRVKNNLQIISSLLNLQAEQIDDKQMRERYHVSRDRIITMALVHEKLYESQNLSRVDFGEYLNTLAKTLNLSYNPDSNRISMEITAAEKQAFFPIETAVPCALIVNELLTNSFKYAFPGNKKGKISIRFAGVNPSPKNKEFLLHIADNGIGLNEKVHPAAAETLGFQLVTMLADQLDARYEVENKNGTAFTFYFSLQ